MANAGYKGRLYIDDVQIGGIMNWNYSGEERELHEDSPLGQEHHSFTPGQYEGGEITCSGNCLLDSDTGQKTTLRDAFRNGTKLTNVKLYYDYDNEYYLEPDSSLSPPSGVYVTKYNEVALDKGGLVTISITMKVEGRMKDSSES